MADNRCRRPNMQTERMNWQISNDTAQSELSQMPIAMAYVPFQQWREIYSVENAIKNGTIFNELNLPFCGRGAV